tara:strand:- start:813 stop:1025 length:213 start_codon:yes stop_codon:yes gene_type:complete
MSTRKTISINERIHLFEELSDGSLYIELEDVGDCTFELWTNEDGTTSRALVRIDKKDLEKIINDYQSREC